MGKDLKLSLKGKWFRMTQSGVKTEEYRERNPYWYTRLCLYKGLPMTQKEWAFYLAYEVKGSGNVTFKKFDTTTLTLGYPSKENKDKIVTFEHLGISHGEGKEEWGAEKGKMYFVIKHGEKL